MDSLKNIRLFFDTLFFKHLLFWIAVFTYYMVTLEPKYYSSFQEALEYKLGLVFIQVLVAYSCLFILIPRYLTPKKNIKLVIGFLFLLLIIFAFFVCLMEFYYQPKFFEPTNIEAAYNSSKGFRSHIFNLQSFTGKSVKFLTPTVLLVIAKFYKDQQKYLQLNEQKKITELTLLKHQLNPHFLFNTLNNLYALSIDKSDQAPEVVERLSEMLDYMLYGCNEKYVPIQKEIELLDNYLALEKVRYGKRVAILFDKNINKNIKIAPLILLTFLENAFKHGVSQELKEARISIKIAEIDNNICFSMENSISETKVTSTKPCIGITNVKKQLELLYPREYSLDLIEDKNSFKVRLKLPVK